MDREKSYKKERVWFASFLIEGLIILISGLTILIIFNDQKGVFCIVSIIPFALAKSQYDLMKVIKEGVIK